MGYLYSNPVLIVIKLWVKIYPFKALDQLLRTLQEHANILDEIKAREDQVA